MGDSDLVVDGQEIYAEPRLCALCDRFIEVWADQITEIWRRGDVSHHHLECWSSIISSDLLTTEDISFPSSLPDTVMAAEPAPVTTRDTLPRPEDCPQDSTTLDVDWVPIEPGYQTHLV